MKRKLLGLFSAIVAGIVCAFGFTACGDLTPDDGGGDKEPATRTDYITLDKTDIILYVGESVTVTATVSDEFDGTVTWESSDTSVATVEGGQITAIKRGGATIQVTAGVETAWCRVLVKSVTTLKDLICDADSYLQTTVRVKGMVTSQFDHSVYIEDYDEEAGRYFGMEVYYGYNASGILLEQLKIGNEVRVCGTLSKIFEHYQISGIQYNEYKPDLWSNTVALSDGHKGSFVETSAKDIVSGKIDVEYYDETMTLDYGEAVTATTVTVSNLKVLRSTVKDDITKLECEAEDGTVILVDTVALTDALEGKTITVKGVVSKFLVYDSFTEKQVANYGITCCSAKFLEVL